MLTLFFRKNKKVVQSTGMTFAVMGTTMHILNEANLVNYSLSHTWSAIAIAGFLLTSSNQIAKGFITTRMIHMLPKRKESKQQIGNSINSYPRQNNYDEDVVALP